MVGSSKILTVKYGTFSCTAEGFEDPLGAVKDTTQFFRHVVKHDRFFGAEPPRFDAALAEEMLRSQLAADLRDGHLTVRASPAQAAPRPDFTMGGVTRAATSGRSVTEDAEETPDVAPPASTLASATAAPDAGSAPDTDEAQLPLPADPQDAAWSEPAVTAAPTTHAPQSPDDEVAAKLARIRAVVGASAAALGHHDPEHHAETAGGAADGVAARDQDQEKAHGPDCARHASALQAVAHAQGAALEAARHAVNDGQAIAAHAPAAPDAPAGAGTGADAPDDAADEPGDMSAPVSQHGEPAHVSGTADAAAEDAPAATEGHAAPASEIADDNVPADECSSEHAGESPEDGAAEPGRAEVTPEAARNDDDPARDPTDTQPARDEWSGDTRSEDTRSEDAADEESEDTSEPSAVVDVPRDTATQPLLGERSDRLVAESSLPPEEEAELTRELAAVRAELQATAGTVAAATPFRLDHPILSDDDDDDDAADGGIDARKTVEDKIDEDKPGEGALQPEDSFLARASAGARKAVRLASPARAMLTEKSVGDTDASRLLAQTNSELDEPEGNRRRNAIAHLRAAVAATRADRALHADDTDAETQRYREDLAKVVRPRRPKVLRTIRSARPASEPQAAPLQLVPQQRADEPSPEPVRPRRVSIADDIGPAPGFAPEDDAGGGFAEYAKSVGATRLPDLLEAAAAYMAFVEGRDQFSRPQLMTVLQRAEGGTATREERLRSFGRLLREGKIEKTRGGRFTASDRIGFRPDARQAG